MSGRCSRQRDAYPVVRAIRKGLRIPRKQRPEDDIVIKMQRLARYWRSEALRLQESVPSSLDHRVAERAAHALEQLPRRSLRCLISTLDEERDFALRCADLTILQAKHALEASRIDRLYILGEGNWWESETLKPLVEANNKLWNEVMSQTIEMAETPVRNHLHLKLKRRLIGRIWLGASGEPYDRMRAGIAADEHWLQTHRPKTVRPRRARAD